ncbi:Protein-glutamate methylesterase/protein-glutamine glutaminase [Streptomyces californicus]
MSTPSTAQDEQGAGGRPLRVMVVDDHPMWRDAVARDLAEAGFDVVATAGDGPGAVRRAGAVRPDVLVLDLNLPGMPGVQVCKELVGANPALRVLVLSASGEHADVLEAVKSGATGYLLKSASTQELIEARPLHRRRGPRLHPGAGGPRSRRVPPPRLRRPPPRRRASPRRAAAHRARDRGAAAGRQGPVATSRSPSGW